MATDGRSGSAEHDDSGGVAATSVPIVVLTALHYADVVMAARRG